MQGWCCGMASSAPNLSTTTLGTVVGNSVNKTRWCIVGITVLLSACVQATVHCSTQCMWTWMSVWASQNQPTVTSETTQQYNVFLRLVIFQTITSLRVWKQLFDSTSSLGSSCVDACSVLCLDHQIPARLSQLKPVNLHAATSFFSYGYFRQSHLCECVCGKNTELRFPFSKPPRCNIFFQLRIFQAITSL